MNEQWYKEGVGYLNSSSSMVIPGTGDTDEERNRKATQKKIAVMTDDERNRTGIVPVQHVGKGSRTEDFYLEARSLEGPIITYSYLPRPVETVMERKLKLLAEHRYQVETGGIIFGGISISTDRETTSLITGKAVYLDRHPGVTSLNWKTSLGFISIPRDTFLTLADAVHDHVQGCFDKEGIVSQQLADLTPGDVEDLIAFDIKVAFTEANQGE